MDRQEVGKLGEKAARKFLKKRGYRIRETGFRCRHGEIDIIAQKKDYLVFVEVRTKSNLDFGNLCQYSQEPPLFMAHRRCSYRTR